MPSTAQKTPPPPPLGTIVDDGNGALELVSVLGCGGYGVVYRARDLKVSYPCYYAVKCLVRPTANLNSRQRQLHLREIALHQLASPHRNVVAIHRVIDPPHSPYTFIVMDYCPDGDLFTMILHNRRYLGRDSLIKHVFLQLLDAVEYCHSLGIYHRDMKPENVLCINNGLDLAVTDFGLATTDKLSSEFRTGSVYHMSPECQGGAFAPSGNYSPPANDIWSLGIILLNLCTGRNPWKSATANDPTFSAYLASPSDFLPSVLPISQQLNAIMTGVLAIDWKRRTSLKEFKEKVKHVENFYSDDVIFEGSMARCPWEVGMNLDDDGDDEGCPSVSYTPPGPSTPPPENPTPTQKPDRKASDRSALRSRWSSTSASQSDMVFASPSIGDDSSSSEYSRRDSASAEGVEETQPPPLVVRKKPNLKLEIRKPYFEKLRLPATPRSERSSSFTFTLNASSSQADSMRSASPDFPETPPSDAQYDFATSATDTQGPAPPSAISETASVSYHTTFDGNSLEASHLALRSDSTSGVFKILPSPGSEQKGYNLGRWQEAFRSMSPSPESSYSHTGSDHQRADFPMQCWDSEGKTHDTSKMDADWATVVTEGNDEGVAANTDVDNDASMSPGADGTHPQEDNENAPTSWWAYSPDQQATSSASFGTSPESRDHSNLPASWDWASPRETPAAPSFTLTSSNSRRSTSFVASPIVVDESIADSEPTGDALGLDLNLHLESSENELNGGCELSPQEVEMRPAWRPWVPPVTSKPMHPGNDASTTDKSSSTSGSYVTARRQENSSSPRYDIPHEHSPLSHTTIQTAYRTTLSSTNPPSLQFIPPTSTRPVVPNPPRKATKSQPRSALWTAFSRAFSASSSSRSPSGRNTALLTSIAAVSALSQQGNPGTTTALCALVAPKPQATRRSRFTSSGNGARVRALDRARSRSRSKLRNRPITRPPSPRDMLRTARNWFWKAGTDATPIAVAA